MASKCVEIDVTIALPDKSYVGERTIIKKSKKTLTVYYENRYPNGKLKTERFQPAKATIPAKIKCDEDFIESAGMYYGDGQNAISSKSYQETRFANSDTTLVIKYLKFLQALNVNLNDLKVSIRVRKVRNSKQENEILAHWQRMTRIPKSNFYKIQWEPGKYHDSKVQEFGTASIIYSNSSFRLIFDSLAKKVQKMAKKNRTVAAGFLRGLIAADGNVYFDGKHREVSIAAKEEANRELIRKLFKKLGIIPNKDNTTKGKEAVTITGYSNLKLIEKYRLCELHPSKEPKFKMLIETYKVPSYRKGVGILSITKLIKQKDYSVGKLSKKLKRTENAIRRHLYRLEKEGKVIRKTKKRTAKTGRSAEVWGIND